MKWKYFKNQ